MSYNKKPEGNYYLPPFLLTNFAFKNEDLLFNVLL